MGVSQIGDVHVVAQRRSIGGRVVRPEHLDDRFVLLRRCQDDRDQVRFEAAVVLAEVTGRIGPGGVEVPQAGVGKIVRHAIGLEGAFEGELGLAIRAGRSCRMVLPDRDILWLPVDRRRRGEDDAAPASLTNPLEQLEAADQVIVVVPLGPGHRLGHQRVGRQVNHRVERLVLAKPRQHLPVREVGHLQRHVADGLPVARRQVVDDDGTVPRGEQPADHVRPDVAGAPGHQNPHGRSRAPPRPPRA